MAAAAPAEAAAAVRRAASDAVATLREIPPERWQSLGRHRRQGAMTVADFVEQMMVVHGRAHLSQAQAAVETADAGVADSVQDPLWGRRWGRDTPESETCPSSRKEKPWQLSRRKQNRF